MFQECGQILCYLKPAFNLLSDMNKLCYFNMLHKAFIERGSAEMLSKIRGFPINKSNPSGAPLLPNLRRYQALAVL